MDRRPLVTVGIGLVLAGCAAMYVTASPTSLYAPLYNMRMEQQSNELHFLPNVMNAFAYSSEEGCRILYSVQCCSTCNREIQDLITIEITCSTCASTCESTCLATCPFTCETCDICPVTQGTEFETCEQTCSGCATWQITCGQTCNPTCTSPTCFTCYLTCATYAC
jgi:hypothetical protein